jgi:hypothetical protein
MSLGMIRAVTYSLFSTERCRQKLMKKGVVQDLIWACLPHQFQFSFALDHLMGQFMRIPYLKLRKCVRNITLTLIEREDDTRSWGNFLVYFSHSTTMSCPPRG